MTTEYTNTYSKNINGYIDSIKDNLAVSIENMSFKSDNRYMKILEHVNKKVGYTYLEQIKTDFVKIYKFHLIILQNVRQQI